MMKKLLSIVAMLVLVLSASAKTLECDLSALPASSENTTWDAATNTFAWSQTSYNSTQIFPAGDYSAYKTLNISTTAGTADHFRIIFKFTNGTGQVTVNTVNVGDVSLTWEQMGVAEKDIPFISTIRLSGANNATGDVVVNSISLEGPDVNYIEAIKAFDMAKGHDCGDMKWLIGTNANWASTVTYPKNLKTQGEAFGDGDGSNEATHVSIAGIDYVAFEILEGTNAAGLRTWIWDGSKVVTLYAHPIAEYNTVEDWTEVSPVTAPGTYVVKVRGYEHLKGVKAGNDWSYPTMKVGIAYVGTGAPVSPQAYYILQGEAVGSPTLTNALNDVTVATYDATRLTNTTPVELVTANPNAIIIATEGKVANDHNVLVDYTINKLQLTDGYPLLLPDEASNANGGYYERDVTTEYSTACLPLCFSFSGEGVYMFDGVDGDVLTFRELEGQNMSGLKGSYAFLLKGAGKITMNDGGQIYQEMTEWGSNQFYGTYSGKTLASDEVKSYYGFKGGEFVKAGSNVKVPPFRAYFRVNGVSEVKSFNVSLGDETAINGVAEGLNSARAFYNAAGVRQNGLQKGLNIVEMSNGSTRKIMIK